MLSIELEDLAAGEAEAKIAAAALRDNQQIEGMQEELRNFAERLAPMLVYVALSESRLKGSELTKATIERLEAASARVLGINWGRDLNNELLMALRSHPYLADIKPELAAPTYGEILKRVSQLPIVWPHIDESDT